MIWQHFFSFIFCTSIGEIFDYRKIEGNKNLANLISQKGPSKATMTEGLTNALIVKKLSP